MTSPAPTSGTGYSDFEAVIVTWARCYSQILLTLDDQEFFEQQQYFTLDELRHMTSVLNRLVFRQYWNPPTSRFGAPVVSLPSATSDDASPLRTVLTNLLRQLYDRDARRQFCPEGHWLADIGPLAGDNLDLSNERLLAVLRHIPFVIAFNERVKIFHQLIDEDKNTNAVDNFYHGARVTIRRDFIFEDGLAAFTNIGNAGDGKLKQRMKVEFVASDGLTEAGIDGGGLYKDFMTDLVKKAFFEYALFLTTEDHRMYPNPSTSFLSIDMDQYVFLGRVLGKALYDSILVELPLANFFLAKILGKYNLVNDLIFLDPQLHKNLMYLKTYEGNIEDLALTFSLVDNQFGQGEVRELIAGGKDIPVTSDNKIRYIYLVAHHRLNVQIKQQCDAFLRGFSELIKPEWIRIFNQEELQFLISGSPGGIDLVDMRANTVYSGGYSETHNTILMFWDVVAEFSPSQQRDLLRFVTSCSRPPLLGFGYLTPRFCIHVSHGDAPDADQYLPSASTCFNLLKLPPYGDKKTLREKLLYSITSGAGFDLS